MKKAARPETGDVAGLSFEMALTELESLVDRLDKGEIELAQAIDAYERGTALRRHCEQKLDEARMRVDRIAQRGDGERVALPLDDDATDTSGGGDAA